jgi:hypothetical protein
MPFWTYILRLNNGDYYTGHTDDLDVRLAQHQRGALKGLYKRHLPVELMWAEEFPTQGMKRSKRNGVSAAGPGKEEGSLVPGAGIGQRSSHSAKARPSRLAATTSLGGMLSTSLDTSG